MNEIIAILSTLSPHLNPRTLNRLAIIVEAVLSMTGRVTLLGLSRWAEKGGSYRTVQRFFQRKNRLVKVALATHQAAFDRNQRGVAAGRRRGHGDQVRQGNAWAWFFFLQFTTRRSPACAF